MSCYYRTGYFGCALFYVSTIRKGGPTVIRVLLFHHQERLSTFAFVIRLTATGSPTPRTPDGGGYVLRRTVSTVKILSPPPNRKSHFLTSFECHSDRGLPFCACPKGGVLVKLYNPLPAIFPAAAPVKGKTSFERERPPLEWWWSHKWGPLFGRPSVGEGKRFLSIVSLAGK